MRKIIVMILWVPVAVALCGCSLWWFQETTEFSNPVVESLWFLLRITPGLIGFMMLVCGPMLAAAHEDSYHPRRSR
jgi:hypothetical protein